MRKIYFLLVLALVPVFGFAQVKMSNIDRNQWQEIQTVYKSGDKAGIERLKVEFPLHEIGGQSVLSVLAKVSDGTDLANFSSAGILVGSQINDIVSFKVPVSKMTNFLTLGGLNFVEIAQKVQPLLNKVIPDIRADSVHQGFNLPEKYTGKDVLIGVCDWGFDYTHPMYYDTAMTQTRILAAWDQYKTSGPAPAGFSYGTEYATIPELLAAGSDTANIYSYAYHGGHCAGIAGGGAAGTPFLGVAFEAQFLFATFLIDAGAVMDAYQWMHNKSVSEGKRLVINQSWGLHHIGNLDGTSLLSQAIDNYSAQGVVFVTSGGNNGDVNFHLEKEFSSDTLQTKVDFYPYTSNPNMWGQSVTAWGEAGNDFSLAIRVKNSLNATLASTAFFNTATTLSTVDTFLVVGVDTVFYKVEMEAANLQNSRPHARFRVKNKNSSLRINLVATAAAGTVHFWNVTELTTDVGNWGMPFSAVGAGTVAGNKDYGIGEPACTNSTIAVAAYSSSYYSGSTLLGGQIANFSSFGPTLDGRVKPDISAPGVSVGSAVSHFTDNPFTAATSIVFNATTYKFTRISGTSMSGPAVTGVVALILDANPTLSANQVKEIIKTTARTDDKTGIIPAGGSLRWGAGKVNAYAAVQLALNTVEISENSAQKMIVYPNPATGTLYFQGEITGEQTYEIIDFQGKMVGEGRIDKTSFDIHDLQSGVYLLQVKSEDSTHILKFIVE